MVLLLDVLEYSVKCSGIPGMELYLPKTFNFRAKGWYYLFSGYVLFLICSTGCAIIFRNVQQMTSKENMTDFQWLGRGVCSQAGFALHTSRRCHSQVL